MGESAIDINVNGRYVTRIRKMNINMIILKCPKCGSDVIRNSSSIRNKQYFDCIKCGNSGEIV